MSLLFKKDEGKGRRVLIQEGHLFDIMAQGKGINKLDCECQRIQIQYDFGNFVHVGAFQAAPFPTTPFLKLFG